MKLSLPKQQNHTRTLQIGKLQTVSFINLDEKMFN